MNIRNYVKCFLKIPPEMAKTGKKFLKSNYIFNIWREGNITKYSLFLWVSCSQIRALRGHLKGLLKQITCCPILRVSGVLVMGWDLEHACSTRSQEVQIHFENHCFKN